MHWMRIEPNAAAHSPASRQGDQANDPVTYSGFNIMANSDGVRVPRKRRPAVKPCRIDAQRGPGRGATDVPRLGKDTSDEKTMRSGVQPSPMAFPKTRGFPVPGGCGRLCLLSGLAGACARGRIDFLIGAKPEGCRQHAVSQALPQDAAGQVSRRPVRMDGQRIPLRTASRNAADGR